ncbi:MAG: tetratricopeptide repeat protein [Chitinispirillaceae bacterium]
MIKKKHVSVAVVLSFLAVKTVFSDCLKDAEALMAKENYKEAVLVLDKCSKNPKAFKMLGKAYHELYQMDQARKYLEKHLKKSPDDLETEILLASSHAYSKQFGKAIDKYQNLHEKYPENKEIQKGYARALGWNKDYDAAVSLYKSVLKKDPQDYESALEIGVILSWRKNFREAVSHLTSLIDSKPEKEWEIKARLQRAKVLSWQKKFKKAVKEYNSVLALDSSAIEAYLGIGTVLEWQGKYKQAKANYETALAADPQSAEVKDKLNQLMWVK